MKRIYTTIILALICTVVAGAQGRPNISHQSTGRDRVEFFVQRAPLITYNDVNQQLTVASFNDVDNFELTITSMATHQVELQEVYEGASATINVSFLNNDGVYLIDYVASDGTYTTEFVKSSAWVDPSASTKGNVFNAISSWGEFDLLNLK